jgi:hypothetical protein
VLDALVLRRPILQNIVKCKHICVVFDFYAKDTAAPMPKWDIPPRGHKKKTAKAVGLYLYIYYIDNQGDTLRSHQGASPR